LIFKIVQAKLSPFQQLGRKGQFKIALTKWKSEAILNWYIVFRQLNTKVNKQLTQLQRHCFHAI